MKNEIFSLLPFPFLCQSSVLTFLWLSLQHSIGLALSDGPYELKSAALLCSRLLARTVTRLLSLLPDLQRLGQRAPYWQLLLESLTYTFHPQDESTREVEVPQLDTASRRGLRLSHLAYVYIPHHHELYCDITAVPTFD